MKKFIFLFLFWLISPNPFYLQATGKSIINPPFNDFVISTKQLILEEFPNAFNPSIVKIESGYLLTFRYCPNRKQDNFSYIGIVKLNKNFKPISSPQLLDARFNNTEIPSQCEDSRIFRLNNKLYIIFNDNPEVSLPTIKQRRDMFLSELQEKDGQFFLSPPLKLIHEHKYDEVLWQKNWVPFEWNGNLLLSYSISPHDILIANLETGICSPYYTSSMNFSWKFGILRGGTPALLVDGKYLAFFHSAMMAESPVSKGKKMYHYYMGAYTFSAEPPFTILKMTPTPINGKKFYTKSKLEKKIIFPCGFVVSDNIIYVVYGKDDREIWIATINKKLLRKSMVPAQ